MAVRDQSVAHAVHVDLMSGRRVPLCTSVSLHLPWVKTSALMATPLCFNPSQVISRSPWHAKYSSPTAASKVQLSNCATAFPQTSWRAQLHSLKIIAPNRIYPVSHTHRFKCIPSVGRFCNSTHRRSCGLSNTQLSNGFSGHACQCA